MKEITRIHIAKIPYDIETTAKKEMTTYVNSLEHYANDKELFQDIEIRITELLAERGIGANGVIAIDDVTSIRQQLGEPKDFAADDDIHTDDIQESVNNQPIERKLYRDVDSAVLGGVLSGFASYFRIDTVIVRLIFVVLFFITSGTATLVYIILWIVVPPARTMAEKLQMSGRPVTLDSIRNLSENESNMSPGKVRAQHIRLMVKYFVGSVLMILSICTVIFTIFAAFGVGHFGVAGEITSSEKWVYISAFVLAIISGLLLSALFALGSCVAFLRKNNKKLLISMLIVIAAGLTTFSTAVGLVTCQSWQSDNNESIIRIVNN